MTRLLEVSVTRLLEGHRDQTLLEALEPNSRQLEGCGYRTLLEGCGYQTLLEGWWNQTLLEGCA